MDYQVCINYFLFALPSGDDGEPLTGIFYSFDCCKQFNSNPNSVCRFQQLADEIRIKALQRQLTTVQNRYVAPGARSNVGELKRDVAAPDEDDLPRQLFEFQKRVAC